MLGKHIINVKFWFLLMIFCGSGNAKAQDISGYWQGVTYQPVGGTSTYYPGSMNLTQAPNGSVKGVGVGLQPNSIYYVISDMTGNISNNIFTYYTQIIDELRPPGYYWCTGNYRLTYNPLTETLTGSFSIPFCASGSAEFWRLKILSNTTFCEGDVAKVDVSGQNVRWYTDSARTNLVATGNSFLPNINATTKFYVTQTHYNTESPSLPVLITIKSKKRVTINKTICYGESYLGYVNTGAYNDVFMASNGCDSIRTLNLTVLPRSATTVDKTICEGQAIMGYSASGSYTDVFKTINGCDSFRTLNLTVIPRVYTTVQKTICEGEAYSGYKSTGNYKDIFVSQTGCDSIRTLDLTVLNKPKPKLGPTQEICETDSSILHPGTFTSYLWQDGSTKDHFIASKAGYYSVKVTNMCGSDSDKVLIVKHICDVFFPTAITPNNDGRNDEFKIMKGFGVKDIHLVIYNRWGMKVYESTDLKAGWDGKYKGIPQRADQYVWFCMYTKNGHRDKQQGTFVLIR